MTTAIRATILATLAAATLSLAAQPAIAGGGGPLVIKNPHLDKPIGPALPGKLVKPLKPVGPVGPKPPSGGHDHDAAAAAALGLIGGVIIGAALAGQNQAAPVAVGHGHAHVGWCLERYKSYDVGTDTFMSKSGQRKLCNSPYN